jgi:replicative superfamily II helicase
MIDFRKRLAKRDSKKLINPIKIYETLDRTSDKGPLRPAQIAILEDWNKKFCENRDVIVKLHTGQGKTLIGLLILQSQLNQSKGRVVYLCPNKFLINQTCEQAKQFGIGYCTAEDDLPVDFLDGKKILITSIQKVFNGLTKFGIESKSIDVSTLLMDDAHACIDAIRASFQVRLPYDNNAYREIINLFSEQLKNQGMGTFADIENNKYDVFLPVPYWDWQEKQTEVVDILARYTNNQLVKFAWPLIRDRLDDCQCIVSGHCLEIVPHLPPLRLFGTYDKADQRIFMSATVTDDSFLVKGLGLSLETIKEPLVYKEERWSGEKMILIPSLIDESLNRTEIVNWISKENKRRSSGVVALVPSSGRTKDWGEYGASIANKQNIDKKIEDLKKGDYEKPLVIVNRYDGIDLPDDTCRILIFDSKPFSESLVDLYSESCRSTSEITAIRIAKTIEQGMGRSVRGEKDYCVIVFIGSELVKCIRTKESRKYLSNQTRTQIEIGLDIVEFTQESVEEADPPFNILTKLIGQCLKRDEGWKEFYVEKMEKVIESTTTDGIVLELFQKELEAETLFQDGDTEGAVNTIQHLIDHLVDDDSEKGWYMQEMARYRYRQSKTESNKMQIHAHRKNRYLLKPKTGMRVDKISLLSQKRIENIILWIREFEDFKELNVVLEDILGRLTFGTKADRFEGAFNDIAKALGFSGQRPDKEWKKGPDNLWALRENKYLLVECKNEVDLKRQEISKSEAGQMNSSYAWFKHNYPGCNSTNIMIIPAYKLAKSAAFSQQVQIMRAREIRIFTNKIRSFFNEFEGVNLKDLSEQKIQKHIDTHGLSVESIISDYKKEVYKGK